VEDSEKSGENTKRNEDAKRRKGETENLTSTAENLTGVVLESVRKYT
jgi:hypothetical protein